MRMILAPFLLSLPGLGVGSAADAEVPRVVTDIVPVHSLVSQVMGTLGAPVLLLDKGADAHDFQLRPSQAGDLAQADLVVWVGPQMTSWLDRALNGIGTDGTALTLLDVPGTHHITFADTHHHEGEAAGHSEGEEHVDGKEHADGTEHADGAEHVDGEEHTDGEEHADGAEHAQEEDHEGHDHTGLDPHAWLDPGNAELWLDAIAEALSAKDPENAGTYRANAAAAKAGVATLDAELAAALAPIAGTKFVVFHAAYGYFTDHFGLMPAEAIALGDATTPGAETLSALRAEMESESVACIFPEVRHDPALTEMLAEGTGVAIGDALDPEGAGMDPGPGAYQAILRGLADTLTACIAKG